MTSRFHISIASILASTGMLCFGLGVMCVAPPLSFFNLVGVFGLFAAPVGLFGCARNGLRGAVTYGLVAGFSAIVVRVLFVLVPALVFSVAFDDRHVDEDISHEEFERLYDTRIRIPRQASSIYVYSGCTIDSWDVRVVMDIPASEADGIITAIQREMGWKPGGVNPVSNKMKVVPLGWVQSVGVLGWEEPETVFGFLGLPGWWRSVTLKEYDVIALGIPNGGARYVWLYNDDDHKLAMWRYSSQCFD